MKKTIFTLSFFLWFATIALTQNWEWARSINGVQNVQVSAVTVDSQNNIYIAGTKQGTVHFSDTDEPVVLTGANVNTQYMAKYTSQGTLLWAVGLGGETQGNITHLHIDSNGDLFVAGSFQSNATTLFTVRGTGDFEVDLEAVGGFDAFYAKYNADGELYWAHSVGSPAADRLQGIATNISGDIATVGYWRGGTLQLSEEIEFNYEGTMQNGFFALHNQDGSVKSALQFAGEWVRLESGVNSCLNEGFVSAINFQQNLILPNGQELISGGSKPSDYQQVLIKINNDAEIEWYIHPETTASMYGPDAITTDSEGFTYFAGRYTKETTFPSYNSEHSITMPPIGIVYTGFLAKYDKLGNVIWVKAWGGNAEVRTNWVSENNGLITVAGHSFGNFTINDDTGLVEEVFNLGGKHEGFAINFDSDGNILGTIQIEGNLQNDALTCVVDNDQNTIIGGAYQSNPLTIGEFSLYNEGGNDAFLAKHINLRALVKVSNPNCYGDADGGFFLNDIAGGEAPYTYSLSMVNGDEVASGIFSQPIVFNDLETGTYKLVVVDADNNSITRYYHIVAPQPININATVTHVSGCFGNDNGGVTLNVTGGTPEYSFFWDTERGYGVSPTTQNQGSLTAGIYNVTVTDANGCTATESFELTQPERINFGGSTITNNSSTSSPNGAINLMVNNGAEPYSFNWKEPNGEESNSQNLSGIRGGAYVLYLEDANGCNVDTVFNVLDENKFNAYITKINNPKCKGGSDGSVTIDLENVTGNITIEWSNGQTDVTTATNLSAGEYWVSVTDDMGTPGDDSDDITLIIPILVGEPLYALDVRTTVIKTTCPTDNDGSILLTVNGCSSPYEYSWSTTDGSGIVEDEKDQFNLSVGSYSYNVTDIYGCTVNSSVQVSSTYSAPSFTIDVQPDNNVCQGTEVEVSVSPGFNYLFIIDDIPQGGYSPNTTLTIKDPVDGMSIKVVGMNTAGCTKESEEIILNVTPNVEPPIFVQGATQLCEGATETYLATAVNAEFIIYSLVSGSATVDPTTGEVTNITENFTIAATAYGYNNCGEEYVELEVIVNPTPTPVISTTDPLEWLENADIDVTLSTDITDAEAYQWFHNNNPISGATQSTYQATQAGIYSVEVTMLGCNGLSNEIEITLIPVYAIAFSVEGENNEPVENAEISIEGYQSLFTNDIGTATIELPNGDYTFQISATCYHIYNGTFEVDNSSQMVGVTLNAYPVPVFVFGQDMLCEGATETYAAEAEGNLTMSYTIVNGTATADPATGEVTNITDDFTIRATASFADGCEKYTELEVTVNPIPTPTISTTDPLVWTEGEAISVTFVVDITDGEAYQWLLNDEIISGATQNSYQATQEGIYSVEVTKFGCMGMSNTLEITVNPVDTYTVSFYVSNDKGESVKNAEITVTDYTPIITDNDGFAFIDLPNGTYTFSIIANDHEGYSDNFEVDGENISIPVELIYVSISTEQLISAIPYPNPFGNEIYIENEHLINRVIVSNIAGQKILDTTLNESIINTSEFKPGIYIITLVGNDGNYSIHKMIKQ